MELTMRTRWIIGSALVLLILAVAVTVAVTRGSEDTLATPTSTGPANSPDTVRATSVPRGTPTSTTAAPPTTGETGGGPVPAPPPSPGPAPPPNPAPAPPSPAPTPAPSPRPTPQPVVQPVAIIDFAGISRCDALSLTAPINLRWRTTNATQVRIVLTPTSGFPINRAVGPIGAEDFGNFPCGSFDQPNPWTAQLITTGADGRVVQEVTRGEHRD